MGLPGSLGDILSLSSHQGRVPWLRVRRRSSRQKFRTVSFYLTANFAWNLHSFVDLDWKEPLHVSEPNRGPSSFSCSNLFTWSGRTGLEETCHPCSSVSGSYRPRGTYHGAFLFWPLNTYSMRFVTLGGYVRSRYG